MVIYNHLGVMKFIKGGGKTLECCKSDNSEPKVIPKSCLQIKMPPNENSKFKGSMRCLSAPRAADTSDRGCKIQPVRQVSYM